MTAFAVVGETAPKRLALGAAIPLPPIFSKAASNEIAIGWAGTRRPTVVWFPVMKSLASSVLGNTKVIGPGQ